MRVLWFPGNEVIYRNENNYHGGGWTKTLAAELLSCHPDIELGMVIPWSKVMYKKKGNVHFYGLPQIRYSIWRYTHRLSKRLSLMKNIVEDFKPDIIHVFGSEHIGGLVSEVTTKPVVLHIQGVLCFCKEAWLPYNLSWGKYISMCPKQWLGKMSLDKACKNELLIFKTCHHYMGRTDFDQRIIDILSPGSSYYFCNEMLRDNIYNSKSSWNHHECNHKIIISIISGAVYKGGDVILRTAKILKEVIGMDFEWKVCGVDNLKTCENLTGIKAQDVNVTPLGGVDENQLIINVLAADVFVHPSYIENSPNTVCEAQLLGIPVIACHVGGIGSLISNGKDGILIPANDIFMMASHICQILANKNLALSIGAAGRLRALARHNPETIVNDVIGIYQNIIKQENTKQHNTLKTHCKTLY